MGFDVVVGAKESSIFKLHTPAGGQLFLLSLFAAFVFHCISLVFGEAFSRGGYWIILTAILLTPIAWMLVARKIVKFRWGLGVTRGSRCIWIHINRCRRIAAAEPVLFMEKVFYERFMYNVRLENDGVGYVLKTGLDQEEAMAFARGVASLFAGVIRVNVPGSGGGQEQGDRAVVALLDEEFG